MSGMIDWDGIEDRGRFPRIPDCTNSVQEALSQTAQCFRVNRQSHQDNYIEVWCEKDALSGILERITDHYHINFIITVLHQLDQKIIYPHYDFKHLTEKYFEIGMKLNDFSIQLVKY
jgi:hypothetical protein